MVDFVGGLNSLELFSYSISKQNYGIRPIIYGKLENPKAINAFGRFVLQKRCPPSEITVTKLYPVAHLLDDR